MYDNFKVANYNNSLVSPELYARPLSRLFTGEVINGFTVVPKTGLTVTLQPGNAFIRYGSTDVASARLVSLVAGFDLAHNTADASNPRIDVIVVYVDTSVTFGSATADGKGAAKAIIVAGTPNANPVAPTATAIQSAVGASNAYIIVSQDRVDAGVSVLASNKITDVRTLSGLPSGSVTYAATDGSIWWEELGRSTLTAAASTFPTITIPTRKYIRIAFSVYVASSTADLSIRFNNDSGSNYSFRYSVNGGADTTRTSQTSVQLQVETSGLYNGEAVVSNVINFPKSTVVSTAGARPSATSAPDKIEFSGLWTNTSDQITSITVLRTNGSGNYSVGSEVVVMGHD